MNIGNQPAFPSGESYVIHDLMGNSEKCSKSPFFNGMTYRQWLIGMLASGEAASGDVGEVGWLLRRADAIIAAQELVQHAQTSDT